jgi:hypothetical protein
MGLKIGANYGERVIVNTVDQIAIGFVVQTGRVGQGGEILANELGLVVIVFELQPLVFSALGKEGVEERV